MAGISIRLVTAIVAALALAPLAAQEQTDLRPEQAIALYDQGRYAEARPLLEALDAEGEADGPLLYRLSFCRRAAGDIAGEREARERAISALERDNSSAPNLEIPFYLANAYTNAGRSGEARAVARAATARVEAGEIPRPDRPMEMFRLAKLYADQNAEERAAEWYRKSIEGFSSVDGDYPGNVAWARRYLAERAYARADYAEAAEQYGALAGLPGVSPRDLDRLAVARIRIEDFRGAEAAWRQAEGLDPANADRPRYCRHLARMAAALGSLPARSPDGSEWSRLKREQLETMMAEQVETVRSAIRSAGDLDDAGRAALQQTIDRAKPVFVRAALEYAVRDYPIRETAFAGGYAPMIFHDKNWKLP